MKECQLTKELSSCHELEGTSNNDAGEGVPSPLLASGMWSPDNRTMAFSKGEQRQDAHAESGGRGV